MKSVSSLLKITPKFLWIEMRRGSQGSLWGDSSANIASLGAFLKKGIRVRVEEERMEVVERSGVNVKSLQMAARNGKWKHCHFSDFQYVDVSLNTRDKN